jgi:hypothetical protein
MWFCAHKPNSYTFWEHMLLADGKRVALLRYAMHSLRVYGEDADNAFTAPLPAAANRLTTGYTALGARPHRRRPRDSPSATLQRLGFPCCRTMLYFV